MDGRVSLVVLLREEWKISKSIARNLVVEGVVWAVCWKN